MATYVVCTIKSWNIKEFKKLKNLDKKNKWVLITDGKNLTLKKLKKIKPRYVFFPHWSWIIPESIWSNFECVIFHNTDVPFGRGGSPLQNLIARGIYRTKMSALRAEAGLDSGPVYMKRSLPSLRTGTAEEIFKKSAKIAFKMIREIASKQPKPRPQKGRVVRFKRRKPAESDISKLRDTQKVYDFIRMLDAEGYPKAFVETAELRFEFSNASLKKGFVTANVKIRRRGKNE
jgi:methionyl-tRNA formyltransferase